VKIYEFFYQRWGKSNHHYKTTCGAPANYALHGTPFLAYETKAGGTVPIYSCYNHGAVDHLYTKDKNCEGAGGYGFEGVAFYAYPNKVDGTVPIYRYFGHADHYYTPSGATPSGYGYESVAFYAFPGPKEDVCNWQCYLDRYPDLQRAFGPTNVGAAKNHWARHGKGECRDCTCPEPPTPAPTHMPTFAPTTKPPPPIVKPKCWDLPLDQTPASEVHLNHQDCEDYVNGPTAIGCGWTRKYNCRKQGQMTSNKKANPKRSLGYCCCCEGLYFQQFE